MVDKKWPGEEDQTLHGVQDSFKGSMKPYYEENGITIYNADCREVLPTLPTADLLLTDPPYGIDWGTQSKNGFSGGKGYHRVYDRSVTGDDQPFDPSPFLGFPDVILWGSNNFANALPLGTTLVWFKKNYSKLNKFLSDGEIAWEKGGRGVYVAWIVWDGCAREVENQDHYHPTQKPIALMRWCLERHPKALLIVDPFMGSGPTLLAAKALGRKAIGVEIEERYAEIAANRLRQEVLQFA